MYGLVSPTINFPLSGEFNPTTPVPKNGSIQFAFEISIPERSITSFIQGTSLVFIPCDFIGGIIVDIFIFLTYSTLQLETQDIPDMFLGYDNWGLQCQRFLHLLC